MTEKELLFRVAMLCALLDKEESQEHTEGEDWQLDECLNGRR